MQNDVAPKITPSTMICGSQIVLYESTFWMRHKISATPEVIIPKEIMISSLDKEPNFLKYFMNFLSVVARIIESAVNRKPSIATAAAKRRP